MNFLKYIELSAENLQFYLWFRDYSKRFNELPDSEKALSPEWTSEMSVPNEVQPAKQPTNALATTMLQGTDFASDTRMTSSDKGESNPFFTPPRTPTSLGKRDVSLTSYDDSLDTDKATHTRRAAGAFESAGLRWKPCESGCSCCYDLPAYTPQ